jgi:hypothetical protein
MASSSDTGMVGAADSFKTEFSEASPGSERGDGGAGRPEASVGAAPGRTAQTAADVLSQQAAQFAADVTDGLNRAGEAQKARGVEAIRGLARAIDGAADQLRRQSPLAARAVHEAARGVDGLSDNLSNRNLSELVDAGVRLARAQPALFVAGSVVAGFALGRLMKSGSRQRPAGSDYEI